MGLISLQDLNRRVKDIARSSETKTFSELKKSIENELINEAFQSKDDQQYDVFLSHRFLDAVKIKALKEKLEEEYSLTVFVDWIDAKQLSRKDITKATARVLKQVMDNCSSLILAYSENSSESVWIPWEMGYFDGLKGRVSIMPILDEANDTNGYEGQEYLGIYPYITEEKSTGGNLHLWVNDETPYCYVSYESWLTGKSPYARHGT